MPSVPSLARRRRERAHSPPRWSARSASVRVISGNAFGAFARAVARETPERITLVSPWLDNASADGALGRVLRHAARHGAWVRLITRRGDTNAHQEAIEAVRSSARGTVRVNPDVHAKVFVCESVGGRGFAVIGSANLTSGFERLDELGVLIRPVGRSRIVRDILLAATEIQGPQDGGQTGTKPKSGPRRKRP